MVAILAAGDAAHEGTVVARSIGRRVRQRRQVFGVAGEVGDVEVVEALCIQRLHADRHILEVLGALGRSDDDLAHGALFLGLGLSRRANAAERRRDEQQGVPAAASAAFLRLAHDASPR
jgi:hypothetical protein